MTLWSTRKFMRGTLRSVEPNPTVTIRSLEDKPEILKLCSVNNYA